MDITSANSKVTLVNALFPAGLRFEGYAADNGMDKDSVEVIESRMGVDGKASFGYTPAMRTFTFHFSADSPTIERLGYMAQAQEVAQSPIVSQMTIELPALGKTAYCTNGVLKNAVDFPAIGKVLENMDAIFDFESIKVV